MRAMGRADDGRQFLWSVLGAAIGDGEFLLAWLALQCRNIHGVSAALLQRRGDDGALANAAMWPDPSACIEQFSEALKLATLHRQGVILRSGEVARQKRTRPQIALAVHLDEAAGAAAIVALELEPRGDAELQLAINQLRWGVGWLENHFRRERGEAQREQAEEHRASLARDRAAFEILLALGPHRQPAKAAMELANQLAARLDCARASVGLMRGARLRLTAMSHAATVKKRSDVTAAIESAMGEAIDQRCTLVHPQTAGGESSVIVAQEDLAQQVGARAVLTLPMLAGPVVIGALTLERRAEPGFDARDVAFLELIAQLAAGAFDLKRRDRRWLAGRIVDAPVDGARALFAARRPSRWIAALAAAAALAVFALVEDEFRVSAKAVLEGAVQRAAVAPFDGFVAAAPARAGDVVREGEVLAILDDKDLVLDKAKWGSEVEKLQQKYRDAQTKRDRVGMQTTLAQIRQAESQAALAAEKLARTRVVAPIDGVVVSGDLSQMLGSPVERGKVLFEVAPLDAYRVAVHVDERDIRFVSVGQSGSLALTGFGGRTLPLTVTKLTPVATTLEGRNSFRIEAQLGEGSEQLRPGMEGIAKIAIEKRGLWWIWTRPFVDWLRLTAWSWLT